MDVMTLAAKLTLNTSEFDAGLNNSEGKMKGLTAGGVAWGNIISNMAQKAGRAMLNFGKQTVQVGMDFDSEMSQVKALGQLQDDEFQQIRQRSMQLGESTKFTAAQVAEAFSYMALAGWDTEEMLDGIDGVLNLAAASGEDLGRTSDIVTDALTAFGLEAKDSAHFVDVLAATSANSNTTVSQMGEAFKYLATTGGVLEYSIDDVATALGLLANSGIKAGQAGTSMRQILNTLINPSDKAAEAMNDLGISLFDTATNARKPLSQLLQELRTTFQEAGLQLEEGFDGEEIQERLDNLNTWYDEEYDKIEQMTSGKKKALNELDKQYEERFSEEITPNQSFLSKLGDIGGLRGISSLFAIMNSSDEDFQQLVDSVANSEGSAEEMSKTMLNNLQGDITILKSAIEGLQIVISDAFNEEFRGFIQKLTTEVGKLNTAFKENGFAGMITQALNDFIGGLLNSTDKISEIVIAIINVITENAPKLVDAFVTIITDPKLWDAVAKMAEAVIKSLTTLIFGEGTQEEKFEKNLFGGFSDETKESGVDAIQKYIEAYNSYNQKLAELSEMMFNGKTDTQEYKDLTDQVEKEGAEVQTLYDELKNQVTENGKDLFSSYMTWAYENGYNGEGDLPDFPVELIPEDEQLLAELNEGYSTVVTLIPDSSQMPEGAQTDGSHAKGLWDVPYDDYTANLHRGEMVLTASQARDYRSGNNGVDFSSMESSIIAAIRSGMEGATVRSYLNGKDITDEVNRKNTNDLKAMRYRT